MITITFQKYYWFKKASPHWDEEYPFPLNVDMVVKDSLEAARPKEKFVQSYLEAEKNADRLNEEFKAKLCKLCLPFQLFVVKEVITSNCFMPCTMIVVNFIFYQSTAFTDIMR